MDTVDDLIDSRRLKLHQSRGHTEPWEGRPWVRNMGLMLFVDNGIIWDEDKELILIVHWGKQVQLKSPSDELDSLAP